MLDKVTLANLKASKAPTKGEQEELIREAMHLLHTENQTPYKVVPTRVAFKDKEKGGKLTTKAGKWVTIYQLPGHDRQHTYKAVIEVQETVKDLVGYNILKCPKDITFSEAYSLRNPFSSHVSRGAEIIDNKIVILCILVTECYTLDNDNKTTLARTKTSPHFSVSAAFSEFDEILTALGDHTILEEYEVGQDLNNQRSDLLRRIVSKVKDDLICRFSVYRSKITQELVKKHAF